MALDACWMQGNKEARWLNKHDLVVNHVPYTKKKKYEDEDEDEDEDEEEEVDEEGKEKSMGEAMEHS